MDSSTKNTKFRLSRKDTEKMEKLIGLPSSATSENQWVLKGESWFVKFSTPSTKNANRRLHLKFYVLIPLMKFHILIQRKSKLLNKEKNQKKHYLKSFFAY